jgi:ERCC4-related helicase
MNRDFFKGTKVEAEAKIILTADEAHRATGGGRGITGRAPERISR